ncbi:MAG: cobalamin-binding protein [Gammaproteobacteria bacterium]|nr:cobalamin-binding protein [Gammaproteobacteria bacterium]
MDGDFGVNRIGVNVSRFSFGLLLVVLSSCAFAKPIQVLDSLHQRIQLKAPAKRVVTLAPNLAEMVFAVGAGNTLVGVSAFSDYPSQAKKLPVVASYHSIDIEKIVSKHPDLVIAWRGENASVQIQQLKRLGIPVFVTSFHCLADISKFMRTLGQLMGAEIKANRKADHFDRTLMRLRREGHDQKSKTVFFELYDQPLLTLNRKSIVNEMIHDCGGRNIYVDAYGTAPQVSVESVVARDPDIILIPSDLNKKNVFAQWQQFSQLKAWRNHRLYVVHTALIERYGPRILQGMQEICHALR